MRSGIGSIAVRSGVLGMLALALGSAAAQPAGSTASSTAKVDTRLLRARITQLPVQSVDLSKAAIAAPAASPAPPAPTSSAGSTASIGKAAALPATKAVPPAAATPSTGPLATARPPTIARWVKLPAAEAIDTRAVLARQLQQLRPVTRPAVPVKPPPTGKDGKGGTEAAEKGAPATGTEPPNFVQFDGAVLTRAEGDDDELALIPLAMVDSPLRFNAVARRYEGRIAIGLMEVGHVGAAKKIATPIGFQVLGDAEIEPPLAQVGSTAPPFQSIRVATQDPREAVELVVHSNISAQPVRLSLPVERAQLLLTVARNELQGWGLESTELSVLASNGEASQGQVVVLSARGHLQDTQLVLDAQGSARTTLRSAATGRVQVSASSPRLQPAAATLDYQFPLRFMVAALVGGVAGGMLRRGMKRGGKASRLALELLLGVLAGAAVLGLFLLGVNVTGFALPSTGGELLVAVVALVGALAGSRLLAAGSAAGSAAGPAAAAAKA